MQDEMAPNLHENVGPIFDYVQELILKPPKDRPIAMEHNI